MATANARVHVTAMLESKGAFERLDEIASVPGIDALTIGPTDLAQDLGVLGTPAQRETLEYPRRLPEPPRNPAKPPAILPPPPHPPPHLAAPPPTTLHSPSAPPPPP